MTFRTPLALAAALTMAAPASAVMLDSEIYVVAADDVIYLSTTIPLHQIDLNLTATVIEGNTAYSIDQTCAFGGGALHCPDLGATPVALEQVATEYVQFKLRLANWSNALVDTVVSDIVVTTEDGEDEWTISAVKSAWLSDCVLEGSDAGSCNTWCKDEGYVSGTANSAVGGLFGGCAGVICDCLKHDGTIEGRTVPLNEIP